MLRFSTRVRSVQTSCRAVTRAEFWIGICFSMGLMISAAPQQAFAEVIADWRFQKGTNGSVAGPSLLIEDSSGHDRHGRAVGGPKYRSVALRKSNLGLVFDGVDDRVRIPDNAIFHLTKSLTIEAYIEIDNYPTSDAELGHIVFRGDDRAGFDPWFLAIMESGQLRFGVADALNNGKVVLSPEPLPTGKLLHVAATLDDETGKQSVYINGTRVASTKTKVRGCGSLGGFNPGIGIGNRYMHSNQAFRGTIAEVRISNEALEPSQFLPVKPTKTVEGDESRGKKDR
jgi:hypothetical protein